jgi:hypothetical protein
VFLNLPLTLNIIYLMQFRRTLINKLNLYDANEYYHPFHHCEKLLSEKNYNLTMLYKNFPYPNPTLLYALLTLPISIRERERKNEIELFSVIIEYTVYLVFICLVRR